MIETDNDTRSLMEVNLKEMERLQLESFEISKEAAELNALFKRLEFCGRKEVRDQEI